MRRPSSATQISSAATNAPAAYVLASHLRPLLPAPSLHTAMRRPSSAVRSCPSLSAALPLQFDLAPLSAQPLLCKDRSCVPRYRQLSIMAV
ncbi:hypothetical protein SLA2020_051600 [Shorea laevis]